MSLDPISTVHPLTGAIRPVTPALLAEIYLCPRPPAFEAEAAIREARPAPWADSLATAPAATIAAVARALEDLIRAAPAFDPASIEPDRLPEGRARRHLAALRGLWADLGTLPESLAPQAHAEGCTAADALEPLPLLTSGSCTAATAADLRLAALLDRHHGGIERPESLPGLLPAGTGALRAFQTGGPCPERPPLTVTRLRDPLEELRHAAARAQRMLDDGTVDSPDEIGLLLPDDPEWLVDAEAVFARLGLHLGGLPGAPGRDVAAEAVHLILSVLNKPSPGMAAVALDALGVGGSTLRDLLEETPLTEGDLAGLLPRIAAHLPKRFAAALRALPLGDGATPIDWQGLLAATRPGTLPDAPVTAAQGALTVLVEGRTPWREVRQLLALGFAGGRFPTVSGSGPLWLEHEIDAIEAACGLRLPGRRTALEIAQAVLDRQFSAVRDGIAISLPARDRAGSVLSPSAALDLLAHRLGVKVGNLIEALPEDPAVWPCAVEPVLPTPGAGRPLPPVADTLDFGRDLTGLRLKDGEPRPQSPSRLETLLVSPLAWLLGELGIEDRSWQPDGLDALVRGSLMHKALETLFPPGPPPDPAEVAAAVPAAVDAAIGADRDLRFLAAPAWSVERQQLIAELTRAAVHWAEVLHRTGATIHATEEYLSGTAFGLGLHGKADVVLKFPDGHLLVMDYKSGTSKSRVTRMEGGWDVQAQLYGDMIGGTALAEGTNAVSVGYLNLMDRVAVTGGPLDNADYGTTAAETHENARDQLSRTVEDLRKGRVRLNGSGDAKTLKDRGIGAWALDNPLVAAFLREDVE